MKERMKERFEKSGKKTEGREERICAKKKESTKKKKKLGRKKNVGHSKLIMKSENYQKRIFMFRHDFIIRKIIITLLQFLSSMQVK